jgi:membrane protein
MKRIIEFIRCYIQAIGDDQVGMRAAALAYFAIFSIFPLALLVISAVGFFLNDPNRQQLVLDTISNLVPQMADIVLNEANSSMDIIVSGRNINGAIAIIGLVWSASGFFRGLEYSINVIFGTGTPRPIWESRGFGIIMAILVIPILFIAVLLISLSGFLATLPIIPSALRPFLNAGFNYAFTLALFMIIFFMIYRFIPRSWTPVRPALIGAVLASAATMVLTYGFNWYLQSGFARYNVVYGSIGAVIALIFYLYLMNYIVLLGAEMTSLIGNTKDCTPAPLPPVVEEYIEEKLN